MEYGTKNEPKFILIDGGPKGVYEKYLSKVLADIKANKTDKLELIVVSHIDDDHVIGINKLLHDRYKDKNNEIINFNDIWFNDFKNSSSVIEEEHIDAIRNCLENIDRVLERAIDRDRGFPTATKLREYSYEFLNLNVNQHFGNKAVICKNVGQTAVKFDNIKLIVIGPSEGYLDALNADWLDWIKHKCPEVRRSDDKTVVIEADTSKPNLSSIMFLAESKTGKKMLFTGDGLEEHIIKGLANARLLDANGRINVDILKVPHHGSYRNVSYCFFRTVIAKAYVLSGDGLHGNPELVTLKWIVEAAMEQKREIDIYVTKETSNVKELKKIYDPDACGYTLEIMDEDELSKVIKLLN